jgi:hypothetical protein
MWHDFTLPDDANHECVDCGVLVDNTVVDELTLACPVPPCPDPSNHDEPCVFVPSEEGAECSYCGRPSAAPEPEPA